MFVPPTAMELPTPDPEARAHSERLRAHIRAEMARAGGAISFARYMELALYAPGLGYYSAGSRKLGAEGDYVSAPELSPLFARCVARQIHAWLEALGVGEVLEVGAGSGALAEGLLGELARLRAPLERYRILERSAEMRARQRARLSETAPSAAVEWLEDLPAPGFRGVVLANELLDALPAARFRVGAQDVAEWFVSAQAERFTWCLRPPEHAELERAVEAIRAELPWTLPEGYTSEVGLAARAWVRELARRLGAGALLLIDYGYPRAEYYHPQRTRGTLSCFYRHRTHSDPLILTGLQDISVHVDFTAVAEAGAAEGLSVAGFTTQGDFLIGTGLLELADEVARDAPGYPALTRQIKRLTLPSDMGELVKVMALTRGCETPGPGFAGPDRRGRL